MNSEGSNASVSQQPSTTGLENRAFILSSFGWTYAFLPNSRWYLTERWDSHRIRSLADIWWAALQPFGKPTEAVIRIGQKQLNRRIIVIHSQSPGVVLDKRPRAATGIGGTSPKALPSSHGTVGMHQNGMPPSRHDP